MQRRKKLNRVMEAETISKNAVSLKNQRSRGNFLLFGMLLLASAVFISCKDKEIDVPAIQVENEQDLRKEISADGGYVTSVNFTTTDSWFSEVSYSGNSQWFIIYPDHGYKAGNYTITISLNPNTADKDRYAIITIWCGEVSITITITQWGTGNSKDPDESVTPDPDNNGVVINGVCWASKNVNNSGTFAAKPEDAGMFYQWNRKKAWPTTGNVTGWDSSSPTGTAWEKSNDPCPAGWRVPTSDEIQKLLATDKVSSVWATVNSKNGRKFTDKSATDNSIFLPAAGYRYYSYGTLYQTGSNGYYWNSTQRSKNLAYYLYFSVNDTDWSSVFRNNGHNVRCVADNSIIGPDVPVEGVELNKNFIILSIDGTEELTATVVPNNATNIAVSWSSSNTNVATVNNGLVTAKAAGSATITIIVRTVDGDFKDFCTVTVIPPYQRLTITSPSYGDTYLCREWVDIYVGNYTGTDWQNDLELEYSCLAGTPPFDGSEPPTYKNKAFQRKEGTNSSPSFTFAPETAWAWEGHWVMLVVQNKKNGTYSEPQYVRVLSSGDNGVVINGIKWANRNVDDPGYFAAQHEDAGMFYQWNRKKAWPTTGDVTDWDSSIPDGDTWEKSNDPCPAGWRVPTSDEFQKLLATDKVSRKWPIIGVPNGISGIKFTDKVTGNSIFFPGGAGFRDSYGAIWGASESSSGCYYSSSQSNWYPTTFVFAPFVVGWLTWGSGHWGYLVRCVAE